MAVAYVCRISSGRRSALVDAVWKPRLSAIKLTPGPSVETALELLDLFQLIKAKKRKCRAVTFKTGR